MGVQGKSFRVPQTKNANFSPMPIIRPILTKILESKDLRHPLYEELWPKKIFSTKVPNSVVDFNPLSTNPAELQPKNQIFWLQPDGYNP